MNSQNPYKNKLEFSIFMKAQVREILIYKWIQSEKLGYNIGEQRASIEWVSKYAKLFANNWRK